MERRQGRVGCWAIAVAATLSLAAPAGASPGAPPAPEVTWFIARVTDFNGKYGLVVRDRAGASRTVVLHQGTIIVPRGLRLERSMIVMVIGRPASGVFAADAIETTYAEPKPAPPVGIRREPESPRYVPASAQRDPGNNTPLLPQGPERPVPGVPP